MEPDWGYDYHAIVPYCLIESTDLAFPLPVSSAIRTHPPVFPPDTYLGTYQQNHHTTHRHATKHKRQPAHSKRPPPLASDLLTKRIQDNPDDPDRTTWQGAPENTSDDVAFTRDALDAVAAAYCIDASRVYATGFSQGGGFIGAQLACSADVSARFAAYAPVSGAYYQKQVDREAECAPATLAIACASIAGSENRAPTPIMAFHGGSDDTIHYEGGFRSGACLPAIRHFVDVWVAADGLDDVPANQTIKGSSVAMRFGNGNGTAAGSGGSDSDSDSDEADADADADEGLVTLVYAGDDVGHVWMSTALGTADFEASKWIMAFFRKHSL